MTQNDIITRLRQSDPSIFQWLYKEYYVALCTYAKKFTRDSQSAEEVVQDAFLKIWENRETLIIRESLIAYLYRTVQNNCLNYLRHLQVINKFNEYYTEKLHEAMEYYSITQENGLSVFIANELEDKIYEAIEKLPAECREIFKLSRFENLKNGEIAELKGITLNTVQKQISIALGKLREALKPFLSLIIVFFFNKF